MKFRIKVIAALLLFITVALAYAAGYLVSKHYMQSHVTIKALGIKVYFDLNCTEICEYIDWGYFSPGENKSITVYLYREGNVNATLHMYTMDWEPENASSCLAVNWNQEGYFMSERFLEATITVSVCSEPSITEVSWSIIIEAREAH